MTNPSSSDKERDRAARTGGKLEDEIRKIIDTLDDEANKMARKTDAEDTGPEKLSLKPVKSDILITEIRNKKDRYYSRTTLMSESEETTSITQRSGENGSETQIISSRVEKSLAEHTSSSGPPPISTEASNSDEQQIKNKRKRASSHICTHTTKGYRQDGDKSVSEIKSPKKKRLEFTNRSYDTGTEQPTWTEPSRIIPPAPPCSCLHGRINMSGAPNRYQHRVHYEDSRQQGIGQQEMFERIDRYDKNHISLTSKSEKTDRKSWYSILFDSRSKNKYSSEDSGFTVPQLYKAKMGHGDRPGTFTFKAIPADSSSRIQQQPQRLPSQRWGDYPPPPPEHCHYDHRDNHYPRDENQPMQPNRSCSHHVSEHPSQSYHPNDYCEQNGQHDRENLKQPLINNDNDAIIGAGGGGKGKPHTTLTKAFFSGLGGGYVSSNAIPEKVDIYCFDQLNTGFFRTSDHPPPIYSDIAIQRTETHAARFWAEIFGFIHIFLACAIAFILQSFKFILQAIVRPLLIGIVQIFADYFFKPLLTLIYNGLTQPVSVFLYNVLSSLRDVLQPVAKTLGYFIEHVTSVLRSVRLIEVKQSSNISPQVVKPV